MRLFLCLLLCSCAAIARDLERHKADGSLACAYVFVKHGRGTPFDAQCRYDSRTRVCTCWNEEMRAGRPLMWQPEEYRFTADVCGAWLPSGLSWPPSPEYEAMKAEIRALAREVGRELPDLP